MECEGSVTKNGEGDASSVTKNRSKICSICGDAAKSQHFGAVSCDSCKAFFRRTVQAENHANYKCPFDVSCLVPPILYACFMIIVEEDNVYRTISFMSNVGIYTRQ